MHLPRCPPHLSAASTSHLTHSPSSSRLFLNQTLQNLCTPSVTVNTRQFPFLVSARSSLFFYPPQDQIASISTTFPLSYHLSPFRNISLYICVLSVSLNYHQFTLKTNHITNRVSNQHVSPPVTGGKSNKGIPTFLIATNFSHV